jgi:TonB family protein
VRFLSARLSLLGLLAVTPLLHADDKARLERTGDFLSTPRPVYPDVARATHEEGDGKFTVRVDTETGRVSKVTIAQSTGYKLLDDAAISALRRWRLKPHTREAFNVPLSFHMSGHVEDELRAARKHATYAPAPTVPFSVWFYGLHSAGRYEMKIDPATGRVTDVKVLHNSRVLPFDQSCERTFRQWRFAPHSVTTVAVWLSF